MYWSKQKFHSLTEPGKATYGFGISNLSTETREISQHFQISTVTGPLNAHFCADDDGLLCFYVTIEGKSLRVEIVIKKQFFFDLTNSSPADAKDDPTNGFFVEFYPRKGRRKISISKKYEMLSLKNLDFQF